MFDTHVGEHIRSYCIHTNTHIHPPQVSISGRILARRVMGKLAFLKLRDAEGECQVCVSLTLQDVNMCLYPCVCVQAMGCTACVCMHKTVQDLCT